MCFTLVRSINRSPRRSSQPQSRTSEPGRLVGMGYLVDVIQLGTRPPAVVGLLPQPLGANFDAAAAGLAAARPVGPLAELTVGGTGDDARLLDVA